MNPERKDLTAERSAMSAISISHIVPREALPMDSSTLPITPLPRNDKDSAEPARSITLVPRLQR